MILDFLNGRTPAYLECEFNLVDVRDAALGHVLAADRGVIGQHYILGQTNIRLSELLAMLERLTGLAMPKWHISYGLAVTAAVVSEGVARLTGRPPVAPLAGVRLARHPISFDSRKAVQVLGLPQTPLEQTLSDAVRWYQAEGLLRRPLGRAAASPAATRQNLSQS